jgi:hypothetical protein
MDQAIKMAKVYIQPFMLNNLGAFLSMQFKWTGSIDNLNYAINIAN